MHRKDNWWSANKVTEWEKKFCWYRVGSADAGQGQLKIRGRGLHSTVDLGTGDDDNDI